MISKIVDWIMDFIYEFARIALMILPDSPFQKTEWIQGLNSFRDIMANVNYFVPFGTLLVITATYLTAVLVWYGVRWILRIARYID